LIPLSVSRPDWEAFTKGCKTCLGYDPIAEIDDAGLSRQAGAFLATLSLSDDPLDSIKSGHHSAEHFFISCMSEATGLCVIQILAATRLQYLTVAKTIKPFGIFSGSFKAWTEAILHFCQKDSYPEARKEFTDVYQAFMKDKGFMQVFSGYNEVETNDGIILLRRGRHS